MAHAVVIVMQCSKCKREAVAKGLCRVHYNFEWRKKRLDGVTCSAAVPGGLCARPAHDLTRLGPLCGGHAARLRTTGGIGTEAILDVEQPEFCTQGCGRKAVSKGLCGAHRRRQRLYGTVGDAPLVEQVRNRGCKFVDETGLKCTRRHNAGGYCAVHKMHLEKYGAPRPIRKMAKFGDGSVNAGGYRVLYKPGHPNAQPSNGLIAEHRFVMSEHLGRPLFEDENVHHVNSDKLDNRLENLELWSVSQPPGARVVDKIRWMKDYIARYEPVAEEDAHLW